MTLEDSRAFLSRVLGGLIADRSRRVALVRDLHATPLSLCRYAADEIEALDRDLSGAMNGLLTLNAKLELAEQCISRMEAEVLEAAERAVSE